MIEYCDRETMVRDKGVAYYGVFSVDEAVIDYWDMLDHGVNAILYAISEFDFYFWRSGIIKVIERAKEMGFKVYLSLWGWGGIFGEGPPSMYLQDHVKGRQVSAIRDKPLCAACFNCEEFKNYLIASLKALSEENDVDYFLLQGVGYKVLGDKDWSCRCECCRTLFKEEYGYEMPKELTADVMSFRKTKLIEFIKEISRAIKVADSKKRVALCLPLELDVKLGIGDWSEVVAINEVDMLGMNLCREHILYEGGVERINTLVKSLKSKFDEKRKESVMLIQGFRIPKGREREVVRVIKLSSAMSFTSIILWPYRAGENSSIESGDPEKLWYLIGKTYREI